MSPVLKTKKSGRTRWIIIVAVVLVTMGAAVEWASRSISERMIDSGIATTTRVRTRGTSENYVYNGDFERGSDQWESGGATTEIVDHGQSGKCLKLNGDGSAAQYAIAWNAADLALGATYVLS